MCGWFWLIPRQEIRSINNIYCASIINIIILGYEHPLRPQELQWSAERWSMHDKYDIFCAKCKNCNWQEKTKQFDSAIVHWISNNVSIDVAKLKVIDRSLLPFRIRALRRRSAPSHSPVISLSLSLSLSLALWWWIFKRNRKFLQTQQWSRLVSCVGQNQSVFG